MPGAPFQLSSCVPKRSRVLVLTAGAVNTLWCRCGHYKGDAVEGIARVTTGTLLGFPIRFRQPTRGQAALAEWVPPPSTKPLPCPGGDMAYRTALVHGLAAELTCRNGIARPFGSKTFSLCCSKTCGECAGKGCSQQPGGRKQCCATAIRARGGCKHANETGCIFQVRHLGGLAQNREGKYREGVGAMPCANGLALHVAGEPSLCCAKSCGTCGGRGCSQRRGGAKYCCAPAIRRQGLCHNSGAVGCMFKPHSRHSTQA